MGSFKLNDSYKLFDLWKQTHTSLKCTCSSRYYNAYLFCCCFHHDSHRTRQVVHGFSYKATVADAVFLKPIKEWSWSSTELRFFEKNYTLEFRVHSRWLGMSSNCNVSKVPVFVFFHWVVDATESLIEQVVKAFLDFINLTEYNCVTFDC